MNDEERELDTVPHGLEPPGLPVEMIYAQIVGEMLEAKLRPLLANIKMLTETINADRAEFRARLRSLELNDNSLQMADQDFERKLMDLDERLTTQEAAE